MAVMNRALCIGVSDYGGDADLPGVANDVASVASLLAGDGGAFGGGTVLLRNSEATRDRVMAELERAFADGQAEQVFVYLAGHGRATGGKYYYEPSDTRAADPEGSMVSLERVRELFEGCRAKRALLFLDCCHSGGIVPRDAASGQAEPREILRRAISIAGGEGKMIYAACTEEQFSYESKGPDAAGFFTRAMVQGIRGKAASADGEVTANGLFEYIDRQVERAAPGGVQRPMQYGRAEGRMVLLFDAARAAPTQALSSGGEANGVDDSGALVMLGDDFFEDARVRASGSEIVVEVPSASAAIDAAVAELSPKFGSRTVAYAHRNDGCDATVMDASAASEGGRQLWTIRLRRQEDNRGALGDFSYSSSGRTFGPLDVAARKARRVLLGEGAEEETYTPGAGRPTPSFDPMAVSLGGRGDGELIGRCPLRDLRPLLDGIGEQAYLRRARLACIYLLLRLDVVERVIELRLGPLDGDRVPVSFRGRRAKVYSNKPADELDLDDACRLSKGV